MKVIAKRRWQVINARAPVAAQGRQSARDGYIEAVARTPIMGFREDVSIRVTPDGEGSRVDIRSASRYFESDLGSSHVTLALEQIRALLERLRKVRLQSQRAIELRERLIEFGVHCERTRQRQARIDEFGMGF